MAKLNDKFENATFDAGATIFRQGDAPDFGYLVQSGTVEIVATRDGADQVLDTLTRWHLSTMNHGPPQRGRATM